MYVQEHCNKSNLILSSTTCLDTDLGPLTTNNKERVWSEARCFSKHWLIISYYEYFLLLSSYSFAKNVSQCLIQNLSYNFVALLTTWLTGMSFKQINVFYKWSLLLFLFLLSTHGSKWNLHILMHFVVELIVYDISIAHILLFRPWMFNSKKIQTLWKDCIVDNVTIFLLKE